MFGLDENSTVLEQAGALGDGGEAMTEKEKMSRAQCTLISEDFVRSVAIKYTDETEKYFAIGKEYVPDIDFNDLPDIPITMTDFFYEADEEARKWIATGPRFVETDEGLEQAGALRGGEDEATEQEKIRIEFCFIFPKDFERHVGIDFHPETKKYFVTGEDYDPDLDRYEKEVPIAMTDFFHEAEKEAWKWIEAGPRRGVL